MAMRDRLRINTQPLLNPGETIEQILTARSGVNPWLSAAFGPIGLILMAPHIHFRIIAITDQSLVILDAGPSGTKPKRILKRLPRDTPITPLKGVWAAPIIDGEKIYIHRKFQKDVKAAGIASETGEPGAEQSAPGQNSINHTH